MNQEVEAVVTFDADNWLFDGPKPKNSYAFIYSADQFRTDLSKLLNKRPHKRNKVKLLLQAFREIITHAPRNPRREVLDAIQQFKEETLKDGLKVGIAVLSGRSAALLGLTRSKINNAGYEGLIDDYYLDLGYGSYQHKRRIVSVLSSWGIPVFHHDDDAMAAAMVVSNNHNGEKVHAFLVVGGYTREFIQKSGLAKVDNIHLCATAIIAVQQNKAILRKIIK